MIFRPMSFPVQQIGLKKLEKQSVPNTVINDTLGLRSDTQKFQLNNRAYAIESES